MSIPTVNTEKSKNWPSSAEHIGFAQLLFIHPSIYISSNDSENMIKNLILQADEIFSKQTLAYETKCKVEANDLY